MAGEKLIHSSKIAASTILEVLISMVIIMVVFGIAMMIYANVIQSSLSVKKLRAEAVLNEVLLKAEGNAENINQNISVDDIQITQVVKPYNDSNNLVEIYLTAYDANQKTIAELHKVIIKKDE